MNDLVCFPLSQSFEVIILLTDQGDGFDLLMYTI